MDCNHIVLSQYVGTVSQSDWVFRNSHSIWARYEHLGSGLLSWDACYLLGVWPLSLRHCALWELPSWLSLFHEFYAKTWMWVLRVGQIMDATRKEKMGKLWSDRSSSNLQILCWEETVNCERIKEKCRTYGCNTNFSSSKVIAQGHADLQCWGYL